MGLFIPFGPGLGSILVLRPELKAEELNFHSFPISAEASKLDPQKLLNSVISALIIRAHSSILFNFSPLVISTFDLHRGVWTVRLSLAWPALP